MAVKDENAHMLATSVYNAFLLVPLYIGMTYKTDIHIHGCVSKLLYRNINNYFQRILCDFSDELSRINITVDGFKDEEADPQIIGTGFSCGVDSLSSVYNRYVLENDPEYRINGLFFYSNGMHGAYGDPEAEQLFAKRYKTVKAAADKVGLPLYLIDTNFHGFYKGLKYTGTTIEYIGGYSCVLALERGIKMYYIPSTYSYKGMMEFAFRSSRGLDFAEFAEHYAIPLIRTKNIRLIPEGGQLERSEKTKQIANWDVAQGYINVCVEHKEVFDTYEIHQNCSHCSKCVRTLLPLDALGKLDAFSGPFDIERYRKEALMNKCVLVMSKDMDPLVRDNYDFYKSQGMKLPSVAFSLMFCMFRKPKLFVKWFMQKLLPEKVFRRIIRQHLQSNVQKRISPTK